MIKPMKRTLLCVAMVVAFNVSGSAQSITSLANSTWTLYFQECAVGGRPSPEKWETQQEITFLPSGKIRNSADGVWKLTGNRLHLNAPDLVIIEMKATVGRNEINGNACLSMTCRENFCVRLLRRRPDRDALENMEPSTIQGSFTLPQRVRGFLNKHYSGWKLSSEAPNCSQEYQQAIVTGDFDGDGKLDYVVKIVSGRKGYFIGLLERVRNYEAHILLETSGWQIKNFGMTRAKKGEKYSIGEYEEGRYGRLSNDAPVIGPCESEACPMVYRNGKFHCD
jgi:hypothetical protein